MTVAPTRLYRLGISLPVPIAARQSAVVRYFGALVITAAITLLRHLLNPYLNDTSVYSFYYAALVLAAWYLGLGPSLLAIVTGAAAASYYFAPPHNSFQIHAFKHINGLIVFLTVGSYLAYLIHWLKCDIARRQKAEADLVASQELVQSHQAELAHMARLTLMGEMSASLAHELNQPLHSARNYAQGSIRRMHRDPNSDPQVIAALERISEESDRAANILRKVRDFVNKTAPHVTDIALDDMLYDAAMIVNMGPKSKRTRVVFDLPADLPNARGDRVEIEQVLVNLGRNAVEAMADLPEEARVLHIGARCCDEKNGEKIDAMNAETNDAANTDAANAESNGHKSQQKMIEVYVRDSGHGIPAQDMPRVFEAFYSTKADGMGMGLAISRSIVERHEGRLWVTANEDRGCTFHFTLPYKEI